jgi:hypothetical protein
MKPIKKQFLKSIALAAGGLILATLGAVMVEDSSSHFLYRVAGVGIILLGMLGLTTWGMVSFVRLRDIQAEARMRTQ